MPRLSRRPAPDATKLALSIGAPAGAAVDQTPAVQLTPTNDRNYAPLGDGFVVTEKESDPRAGTINVMLNWTTLPTR